MFLKQFNTDIKTCQLQDDHVCALYHCINVVSRRKKLLFSSFAWGYNLANRVGELQVDLMLLDSVWKQTMITLLHNTQLLICKFKLQIKFQGIFRTV